METKICTKCGIEKDIDCYEKIGNRKQYTRNICKECKKALNRTLWEKYYKENKKEINNKAWKYQKERKKTDKCYKMKVKVRKMINLSFKRKNYIKELHTEKILGCSFKYFINYLIKTYENNYNEKWDWKYLKNVQVDHIIPLAVANTEDEVIKLCHYSNLQLLRAKDNLDKKDSLEWELK